MSRTKKDFLDENISYYELKNGLRIVHKQQASDIVYCGFITDCGTRDELPAEHGMAHYVEHLLFKGTTKRSSRQIINRIEFIGGELNAYTTKEETVIYAACLKEYFSRTLELLTDMTFHSSFPTAEIKKELSVICDEIDSYKDSPSELIFDDFETLLYPDHPLGNAILGTPESIEKFDNETITAFRDRNYIPSQTVFFSQGDIPFRHIVKLAEQYMGSIEPKMAKTRIKAPASISSSKQETIHKDTHQVHYICGGKGYNIYDPKRVGFILLNNILGGPGMNSRLNLSLRERRGLVYNVESNYSALSDCGWWSIYFGCDPENAKHCEELVFKELKDLRSKTISPIMLNRYKRQLRGQMAIAAQIQENAVQNMGKSVLRFGHVIPWSDFFKQIDECSSEAILEIANEIFSENNINTLKYI